MSTSRIALNVGKPFNASVVLTTLALLYPLQTLAAPSTCTSPLDGAHCVQTFSLVTISYIVIGLPYVAFALLILKPRFERTKPWALALIASPLVSYTLAMIGFSIGGILGILRYPHDISPFFFIDWFVVAFVLVMQTLYVWLVLKKWGSASANPHQDAVTTT